MKMKYEVLGYSANAEIAAKYATAELASDCYFMMMESTEYMKGTVISLETSEVLAHFNKEYDNHSRKIEAYCQKEWE